MTGLISILSGCLGASAKRPECRQGEGLSTFGLNGTSLQTNQLAFAFYGSANSISSEIGSYLQSRGIRAVFFVYGESVRENQRYLSSLKNSGQIVGNGFYTDSDLTRVKKPVAAAIRTDEAISSYVFGSNFLMRFPGGHSDKSLAEALNSEGLAKYAGPFVGDIGGSRAKNSSGFTAENCDETNANSCVQELLAVTRRTGKGLIELPTERPFIAQVVREYINSIESEGFSIKNIDEIPDARLAMQKSGGTPGATKEAGSCSDY